MKKPVNIFFILGFMLVVTACKLATVRPLDPETGKAMLTEAEAQKVFSAEAYVAERWENPLLTTVQNNAVEMNTLLAELRADSKTASETHGHQQGSGPFNFIVKGQGVITEVDTSSRAGLARLDLLPADGKSDVAIAIGPVIRGTALRDAMPFIDFNQFTNQLEFADVSKKLHERVMNEVLAAVDLNSLSGKTITFSGTFAFSDVEAIVITPLALEVAR